MKQEYIVGDVVEYDNEVMIINTQIYRPTSIEWSQLIESCFIVIPSYIDRMSVFVSFYAI